MKMLIIMKLFIVLVGLILALNTNTIKSHQLSARNNNNNDDDKYYGDQPTSYFEQDSLAKNFNRKLTYGQYLSYSQRALSLIAGFDSDLHRYDSRDDLINSFERNLSYRDDLSKMRAHIDKRELELLEKQNELTLIENEQNQSRCGQQLAYLLMRIKHIMTNYTTHWDSKELDILDFIDSFGSPESELMMGNSAWFGSYRQCLEARFSLEQLPPGDNHDKSGGRYCIASFKSSQQQQQQDNDDATTTTTFHEETNSALIKMAICLPESCNSISILRYGDEIDLLAKLVRLNQIPYSQYKLSNLYCLPDEKSPFRQFSLSAKLFILTLSSWLTIVIYFSLKYEYIRMNDLRFMRPKTPNKDKLMQALAFRLSWSNLFSNPQQQHLGKPQIDLVKLVDSEQSTGLKVSNLLEALKQQDHSLISASNGKLPLALSTTIEGGQRAAAAPLVCVVNSTTDPQDHHFNHDDHQHPTTMIDLSVMDGIKVVSMVWLIMAHTLLFFIRTIANGREFWSILRDARYLTVMAGIFPVDTFFTVTGVLTAYLKFNKRDPIGKPKYWLEALVHRYLRFMPMYLIVFWFTRDVSEYLGSGPLWDYSTASTSLRSVCKQESITVPLLFQANFKPLDHHCVKPAWYLANDYQFLLVTPLFMMLIMKSVRLGYSIIGLSIVFSLAAQFLTVFYSNEMGDFGALINFKPMFATYVLKNLWQLYVLPYNRIPPYLIGLLTGHLMYSRGLEARKHSDNGNKHTQTAVDSKVGDRPEVEKDRFPSQESLNSASSSSSSSDIDNSSQLEHKNDAAQHERSTSNILKTSSSSTTKMSSPCSLSDYLCIKIWTPLIALISIIYLPMITKLITQEGLPATIGTSSIIAFMRFVWSLAIARLIYIAATRYLETNPFKRADCFIVRFLASPMWKPWSKIGLSALLIQWEVIGYLAQTQTSVPDMSMTFLLATMLACIVVTYLLAILIYLTVEYPLSQFEQLYIIPALFHK